MVSSSRFRNSERRRRRRRRDVVVWTWIATCLCALSRGRSASAAEHATTTSFARRRPDIVVRSSPLVGVAERRTTTRDRALALRGGGDDDDDDDASENDAAVAATDRVLRASRAVAVVVGRGLWRTLSALTRAARAGLVAAASPPPDDDDDGDESIGGRALRVMAAMWDAASREDGVVAPSDDATDDATDDPEDVADALRRALGVDEDEDDGERAAPLLGGALDDALARCRAEARLLVAFVPSRSRKPTAADAACFRSLRSPAVAAAAGARYAVWSVAGGRSPAAARARRAIASDRDDDDDDERPALAVLYPARSRRGVAPRVLARHHCRPPPDPARAASFLSALRKRHVKLYKAMRTEAREAAAAAERRSDYAASAAADARRADEEKRAARERKAKEEAERRTEEERAEHRRRLLASLPDEPADADADTVTVALRLSDGRQARRRFLATHDAGSLFDWIEGGYGWERDRTILTNMRGENELTHDGAETTTVGDYVGAGKDMVALRVSLKKEEEEEKEEDKESEDESEEEDE